MIHGCRRGDKLHAFLTSFFFFFFYHYPISFIQGLDRKGFRLLMQLNDLIND